MQPDWNLILARQYRASIDMFEQAIRGCPERLWAAPLWKDPDETGLSAFWYVAYHTLFWLDLYLSGTVAGFAPPAPFDLRELDPAGLLPAHPATPADLLAYVDHCRRKAQSIIPGLTGEQAARACAFTWGEISYAELLLDNLRHVQEHGAQLRMLLGQQAGASSQWVAR